jgi:hypothetical protein
VAKAETLAATMMKSAAANVQVRRPLVDRAVAHLQDAMDKLNDATVDPDLMEAGAAAALMSAAGPLAVATGATLLVGMYIREINSVTSGLEATNRQISTALTAFVAGVDEYKTAPMTNYQLAILTTAKNRLTKVRSGMTSAATYGSMPELAKGMTEWVPSIGVVMKMLENLPPEIREQETLNAELLAAYDETCRQLGTIKGTHITAGVETTTDLVKAVSRMVVLMENLFSNVQTSPVADHATYLTRTSSDLPFPAIDFVTAEMTVGIPLIYFRTGAATVYGTSTVTHLLPAIGRLDESLIQTALVMQAMSTFLAVQPPENAVITVLLELLKTLQMGRAAELLQMGNISEFMDASPLGWSYVGNAVDCMKKAMEAALKDGQDAIYDQLDTQIAPMLAKVHGLELRMQRESAYSINTILEKLELTIEELEKLKSSIEGIIDKVDC